MTLPHLPERNADSHKGSYGRALVIAGSRGMTGAATMTGLAALRSGAGLVTIATPRSCVQTIAAFHPTYMAVGLPEDDDGRLGAEALEPLQDLCGRMTCVAIGPGLGVTDAVRHLVGQLYQSVSLPTVVDADGINALANETFQPAGGRVLTPHAGEFRTLTGQYDLTVKACREQAAQTARSLGATLLLKGHESLITDGQRQWINQTGNAGMATAGAGDVLTGVILGLLAQGMEPFDAAILAAHLHGMAGDFAAEALGMHSMIATDLIDYLPSAFLEYDDPTESFLDDEEGT